MRLKNYAIKKTPPEEGALNVTVMKEKHLFRKLNRKRLMVLV